MFVRYFSQSMIAKFKQGNPTAPSRPIGRICRAQKFSEYYLRLRGMLNDHCCCMTVSGDLSFCNKRRSDAAPIGATKIANTFEWPGQSPKITPSP